MELRRFRCTAHMSTIAIFGAFAVPSYAGGGEVSS